MITKDVLSYVESNWGGFLSSVTELSKSDQGVSLVQSEFSLYHFDAVCKSLFAPYKTPASTDGMAVSSKSIELIEFKSGFKQRITKDNFDPVEGLCKETGKVCKEY